MIYFFVVVDGTILLAQITEEERGSMESTHQIDGNCPVCGNSMVISRLSCGACGSALEGSFSLCEHPHASARQNNVGNDRSNEVRFGLLARLNGSQLEFVEVFLRCRGIIKNVEDMLGISYPTVKARLADVLETLECSPEGDAPVTDRRRMRREVLVDFAAGRISIDEVLQMLAHDSKMYESKGAMKGKKTL